MENVTNHASSVTARERGGGGRTVREPLTNAGAAGLGEGGAGRGGKGREGRDAMATCVLLALLLGKLPPRLRREPAGSDSSAGALRALCAAEGRRGRGGRPHPLAPLPRSRPVPPRTAGRRHPPRGARVPWRSRAAADWPRWHRCHQPARNCKANTAEILGLVAVVTRSTLLPPIYLCSSI